MDYTQLSILEVAKLLREGKVTSTELTKQALNVAKEKAEYVTTHIHEDGILNALKYYELI